MNPRKLAVVLTSVLTSVVAFATPSVAQTTWDLANDWSDTTNPNGVWSYNAGSAPIANHNPLWNGGIPAWVRANHFLPMWAKVVTPANIAADDCPVGTVMCHSNDPCSSNDVDLANVTWTSPVSAAVSVCLATWFPNPNDWHQDNRANDWRLYQNAVLLANGQVGDNDAFDSTNPATYSGIINVSIGDVIKLEFQRVSSNCGTFSAVRLNITTHFWDTDNDGMADQCESCPHIVSYCTAGTTTNGCNATMSATGTPSLSATSGFVLTCSNVEGNKFGLIFYGTNGPAYLPWGMASTSYLCIQAPFQRTVADGSGGNADTCTGSFHLDFLSYLALQPNALGQPFSAGMIVNTQAWFRDPPAPRTTNLSNGLQFTTCP